MMTNLADDLAHLLLTGGREVSEANIREHPMLVPLNLYPDEMEALLAQRPTVLSMVESVSQQPWGVLIAALLFAIAGCVYQLLVQLSPEAREALRQEKKKAKKKVADAKAIESRWTNYSKDKGLD